MTIALYRNMSDYSQKIVVCSLPKQKGDRSRDLVCHQSSLFHKSHFDLNPLFWKVSFLNSLRGKCCCISNLSLLLIAWARCCLQV